MKGLGETSSFHRFTNPRRDKSVYFLVWGSYLLCKIFVRKITAIFFVCPNFMLSTMCIKFYIFHSTRYMSNGMIHVQRSFCEIARALNKF